MIPRSLIKIGETIYKVSCDLIEPGDEFIFKTNTSEPELFTCVEVDEAGNTLNEDHQWSHRKDCYRVLEGTPKHPKFRKATKADLKVGQLYIVRYASYDSDLRCVRANMRYGLHMLSRINHIDEEKNRIIFGPKGSVEGYSGLNIGAALIPTDQQIIDDYLLWEKLLNEAESEHPLDYSRGVSADESVDWSYKMDAIAHKKFRKIKNKELGRKDLKIKDLAKGDKFKCTGEITNIMGDLFFEVGDVYEVVGTKKKRIEMNRNFKSIGLQYDQNIEIDIQDLNDKFEKV